MRAATYTRYGSADVVRVEEIERPECAPDEVLIAVRAASVNPLDWHTMTGRPLLMRMELGWTGPKLERLGTDVAGVVEAVGSAVTRFAVGDEVFGTTKGSFAEFVTASEDTLAHKPTHISFEDAAAVPVGALTAMQGLRDHGRLKAGHHVLINGASGGVGTFAVQIAKHLGAEVTGVCSTRNVELVRGLGADHVVDYTQQDFADNEGVYDIVFDNIGNRSAADCRRCLASDGVFVIVGGPKNNPVFGPLWHMIRMMLSFRFGSRRAAAFIAESNATDLELFGELLWTGAMRSVIDTVYPLADIAEGLRKLETGRTRGKIIVTV